MLLCVTNATAHDFEVDGIYYAIISSTYKTVLVTFNGNSSSYSDEYRGNVVIPENVTYNNETYSVTNIGGYAFYNCTGLTSITIPNSVISIGDGAFRGCNGLTSVTIPNSVRSIGNWAFQGCTGLTNIVVDEGNSVYDSRDNCNAIIKTATNRLIAGCRNTVIPGSVTTIGESAFYGCTGLTNVTIPNSVTSIEGGAFQNCTRLKKVYISDLAAWCGIDFEDVSSNPLYHAHNLYLNGELVTELVIPDGVNEIKQYAFYDCTNLQT